MWHSALRTPGHRCPCRVCDAESLRILSEKGGNDVMITIGVTPSCKHHSIPFVPQRFEPAKIFVDGSMWAAVTTNWATSSDKSLLQSIIARVRDDTSPERRCALTRLLPVALTQCDAGTIVSQEPSCSGLLRLLVCGAEPVVRANWRFIGKPKPSKDTTPEGSAKAEDGLLFADVPDVSPNMKEQEATMILKDPGAPNATRVAHAVGPDIVKTQHFEERPESIAAAIKGRVIGKQRPFKPSSMLLSKIRKQVTALKQHVFTKERVTAWMENHTELSDICSKKWTQDVLDRAVESLRSRGMDIDMEFSAKTKDEALPARGKAPRMVIDMGQAGQICSLVTIACLEEILFDWFGKHSIKHKPKLEAVDSIFAMLNGTKCRILEGDGSAWDVTVGPELRHEIEDPIIIRVAEFLYAAGDPCDMVKTWWMADLRARKQDVRKIRYKKGNAFALLVVRAFRASGDRGTSCLNWLQNYVAWTCIVIDRPWLVTMYPDAGAYDGITFNYAFEGDDSVISTDTPKTNDQLLEEWTSLGYNMKLEHRKVGEKVVFVGLTSRVMEDGSISKCVIPEPNRNIAGCAWSINNVSNQEKMLMCYARAKSFERYPPLARYFLAIGEYWQEKATCPLDESLVLDRDLQMRLFGTFDRERITPPATLIPDLTEDPSEGRAVVEAYSGVTMTPMQENGLMSLGPIGPEDRWVATYFPPELLK